MLFDWQTLTLQTVNFVILVWLLHHFLYKPVLRTVDSRRAEIQHRYDAAAAAQEQVKQQLAALQTERAGIAAERDATLKAAALQAEQGTQQRYQRAVADADALLEAGRKALAGEREQARKEARRLALQLGADIAQRLITEIPAKLRSEAWTGRVEQHLAGLSQVERDALVAGSRDVTVVTAASLSAEAQAVWRACLQRHLGEGARILFGADPQLVAGAELHFATAVLRFSWQSVLLAIRAELEADASAGG